MGPAVNHSRRVTVRYGNPYRITVMDSAFRLPQWIRQADKPEFDAIGKRDRVGLQLLRMDLFIIPHHNPGWVN